MSAGKLSCGCIFCISSLDDFSLQTEAHTGCYTIRYHGFGNISHMQHQKFKDSSDERHYKNDVRYLGINQRIMTLG